MTLWYQLEQERIALVEGLNTRVQIWARRLCTVLEVTEAISSDGFA